MSKKRKWCNLCESSATNLSRKGLIEANCLTSEILLAILRARNYQLSAKPGTSLARAPPVDSFNFRKQTRAETIHRHVLAGLKIINEWKTVGISNFGAHYVEAHGGDNVVNFLKSHHSIDVVDILNKARRSSVLHEENTSADSMCCGSHGSVVVNNGSERLEEFHNSSHDDDDDSSIFCTSSEEESECDRYSDISDLEIDNVEIVDKKIDDNEYDTDDVLRRKDTNMFGDLSNRVHLDLHADDVISDSRREYTLREVLEIFQANEVLPDEVLNRLLSLLRHLQPKMPKDWHKELPKDARSLRKRSARKLVKKFKPYKIPAGLSTKHGIPIRDERAQVKLMKCLKETGSTVDKSTHELYGDAVFFGIRDCLFLRSPGNTHVQNYKRTLLRVHAANPNLLSPAFLKIVDNEMYQKEREEGWRKCGENNGHPKFHPNRPEMNCFYLRLFIDGVQVANNSSAPSALPVAFSIERIVPYDPTARKVKFEDGVVIPAAYAQPCIALCFHGPNKPCLHEFTLPLAEEFDRHDPHAASPPSDRDVVFDFRCLIADCPMVSLASGTHTF
jgi:hypothetical protein